MKDPENEVEKKFPRVFLALRERVTASSQVPNRMCVASRFSCIVTALVQNGDQLDEEP